MTTTARVAATTAASIAYTASVAVGVTASFAVVGLSGNESITFESKDSSGGYQPIFYDAADRGTKIAELSRLKNTIALSGPLDFRINKPATSESVEVVEYT